LAITIFLGSLIYSIFRIRTSIEKIDDLSKRVESLLIEHSLHYPEQYLRVVFKNIEQSREPHVRAGHELANEVYKYAGGLVTGLRELRESNRAVQINERFVINDFLKGVVDSLPPRSYWLGVTHLTAAWGSESDPGFHDLVDAMNSRAKDGELTVLRIYCAESEDFVQTIRSQLDEAVACGIQIRILTGKGKRFPPDLSLLWVEANHQVDLRSKPANALTKNATAVCGMEFNTRQGRSLDALSIYSPCSDEFGFLRTHFDGSWSLGKEYKPAEI